MNDVAAVERLGVAASKVTDNPTVRIVPATSSGISHPNSSSNPNTRSMVSRLLADRICPAHAINAAAGLGTSVTLRPPN